MLRTQAPVPRATLLMSTTFPPVYLRLLLAGCLAGAACRAPTPAPPPSQPRALPGCGLPSCAVATSLTYEDGRIAVGAHVTVTNLETSVQTSTGASDAHGRVYLPVPDGEYAIAIASSQGTFTAKKHTLSRAEQHFVLSTKCERVRGMVTGRAGSTTVVFAKHSSDTGDSYMADVGESGHFELCLTAGTYSASMIGATLSTTVAVHVPTSAPVTLPGFPAAVVKSPESPKSPVPHQLEDLVADIERSGARLIGMGEATHGSAEFVLMRERLTLELARRSSLRLVLLENDAITARAIDDYVNGGGGDISALISALGFWITDTREFIAFMNELLDYNMATANPADRIHVWGIDAQDTAQPIKVLLDDADKLRIASAIRADLAELTTNRGKAVMQYSADRRERIETLLAKLATPLGATDHDTLVAVAARSLAVQLGYLQGDIGAMYSERRDAGMAQLASFILERTGARRACLWAHVDHVARYMDDEISLGERMARSMRSGYYPIGFFLYQGSSRAWDPAGKVGVISYKLGVAAPSNAEAVFLHAAGMPLAAWIPFGGLSHDWQRWIGVPRFVRELGAVYMGQEHVDLLINLKSALDAIVVVRDVHDSSPTPTGERHVDASAN